MRFAAYGNLEQVKSLIEQGADVHYLNDYSLYRACQFGHLEVVKCLVKNGATIQSYYDPLRKAVNEGHFHIVNYLKSIILKDRRLKELAKV